MQPGGLGGEQPVAQVAIGIGPPNGLGRWRVFGWGLAGGQGLGGLESCGLVQQQAGAEQAPITAARRPPSQRLEIGPVKGVGGVVHQQAAALTGQLALEPLKPLAHRGGGRQLLAAAGVPAVPAHQQVVPGREQGLHQHVAVLVGGIGVAETALLLQQVEARPLLLPRIDARIEPHQHHHPVRNRPHRLQGTDGEGAAAVAESARIGRQALIEHGGHHRRLQLQVTARGGLLPVVDGGQHQGQFPGLGPALPKQVDQQGP